MLYECYCASLSAAGQLDPAFYQWEHNQRYALIVVDEAQDLSHRQLIQLGSMTPAVRDNVPTATTTVVAPTKPEASKRPKSAETLQIVDTPTTPPAQPASASPKVETLFEKETQHINVLVRDFTIRRLKTTLLIYGPHIWQQSYPYGEKKAPIILANLLKQESYRKVFAACCVNHKEKMGLSSHKMTQASIQLYQHSIIFYLTKWTWAHHFLMSLGPS